MKVVDDRPPGQGCRQLAKLFSARGFHNAKYNQGMADEGTSGCQMTVVPSHLQAQDPLKYVVCQAVSTLLSVPVPLIVPGTQKICIIPFFEHKGYVQGQYFNCHNQ